MTDFLTALKQETTVPNTKGGQCHYISYNKNLDFFAGINRFSGKQNTQNAFAQAFRENKDLALANLLYTLDVREGKGERDNFKDAFIWLCKKVPESALEILPYIPKLGRWDYVLCGMGTPIEDDVVSLISNQLLEDNSSDNPSLLAKWLPSVRTHGKNNPMSNKLAKKLGLTNKEYRKTLTELRTKINIVEKRLSEKEYENIDFEQVPTKAMLKYRNAFNQHMHDDFAEYRAAVKNGEKKINTKGLYCYEIVKKIKDEYMLETEENEELYDLMWNNQKDFLNGNTTNVLVMADTSGSMRCDNEIPMANSLGLATYIAERNHGYFHNHFMTFSSLPVLVEIKGSTIVEKLHSFKTYVEDTNIDLAFKKLLDTCKKNHIPQEDMPSHIIIISDMEFDDGCMSKGGTNFHGWKKEYETNGYELPTIIFWNVSTSPKRYPVTQYDKDVCMVSGFSTSLLEHILDLDHYDPVDSMLTILMPYINMLAKQNNILSTYGAEK